MKQYVTLLLVGTFGLVSCSQDSINENGLNSADKIAIKLDVSAPLSQSVYNELDELFNTQVQTRAELGDDAMELRARQILAPLVEEGVQIRDELIALSEAGKLEVKSTELMQIKDMDETQLAQFAFLADECAKREDKEISSEYAIGRYSIDDLTSCMTAAIGFDAFSGAFGYITGTAGLITARTALQLGVAVVGRTLGCVGVAWAIYDYGRCLRSRRR